MTTAQLAITELVENQNSAEVAVNEALNILDAFVQFAVKDRDINTPPGSPVSGDRYLLGGSPTGAWSGQANKVAIYLNTSWLFFTVKEGWVIWVDDENKLLFYNGTSYEAIGGTSSLVVDLGAIGDGTTDVTSTISAAITAANVVIFPPGTYIVNGGLALKSGLTLRGSGVGVTIIKLKNSASGTEMFSGTTLSDILIENMTLDGNDTNNATNGNAITLNGIVRLTLNNVEIKNFRDYGIQLGATSGNTQYLTIRDCIIKSCHESLIEISNRNNVNVGNVISGCKFDSPAVGETTVKAAIDVRGDIQISDCTIEGVHDNTYGILLRNNDATLGNGAHDAEVENCTIKGTAHASNVSVGLLVQAERCRINNVKAIGVDRGFQVDATSGDDTAFLGCNAKGCVDECFRIGADRVIVSSCHIEGATTGINILSGSADVSLIGNRILAGTTKVSYSGTNLHARNNIGWKTHGWFQSTDIALDTTQDFDKQITLDLDVTPLKEHFMVNMFRVSGTNKPAFRAFFVNDGTAPTSTTVNIYIQMTAAAASTTVRLSVFVDVYP